MNYAASVKPFLWFNCDLTDVIDFYQGIFDNFKVQSNYGLSAEFDFGGTLLMAANFGPAFQFNESFSLFVTCQDQLEVDYYWNRLLEGGGEPGRCGWLKDRFGLSWQIVPTALGESLSNQDAARANYARNAMMGMSKIVISELTQN